MKWVGDCQETTKRSYRCNLGKCQLTLFENGRTNEWKLSITKSHKMVGTTYYSLESNAIEMAFEEAKNIAFQEFLDMKKFYHELAEAVID